MINKILLFSLIFVINLYGIDGAVSLSVATKEKRYTSQEVVLKIDLKTTAFSIKNSKIDLRSSDEYIIVAPQSASSIETIDINGTDWQIVHYEYMLYPLRDGRITIPRVAMSFDASMGYGQKSQRFDLHSHELNLNIDTPKGAKEGEFVLSTPRYTLSSTLDGSRDESNLTRLKVGDAITLQIRQEALNIPDILLSPSRYAESQYFKIYPKEPLLESKIEGDDRVSSRIDSYTFVATKEGNTTIPIESIVWWNPNEEHLYSEEREAYSIVIEANRDLIDVAIVEAESKSNWWLYISATFILLLIAVIWCMPKLKIWQAERRKDFLQSEKGRYRSMIESSTPQTLYRNFYLWLEQIEPSLARGRFESVGTLQPSFIKSLEQLERALATQRRSFDKISFMQESARLRERLLLTQELDILAKDINPT